MAKVKCPYFLSKSNGTKCYINCSTDQHMNNNAVRNEYSEPLVRKVCWEVNCCNDYFHCKTYVDLKKGCENY